MSLRTRGFTLIEISVVLAILGVVLALAAPGLARLHSRIEARSIRAEIGTGITSLPLLAYALGEEGTLAELAARHLALPAGWSLAGAAQIYIRANGVCSGGTVRVLAPGSEYELTLEAPFCASANAG